MSELSKPVAIIMGSQSDWATMRRAAETLEELGIEYEALIVSAHRTPDRLVAFAKGDNRLREWRRREYSRLASQFDPLADVSLRAWQTEWPPSLEASLDAFVRLLGHEPDPQPST